MRLSGALAKGLLALPFDAVVPGVTVADPTLSTLIERLHKARALLPNHSSTMSALDAVLIPLLLFARQNDPSYGPLDTPRNVVTSDVTDFLLLDVTPESYVSIGASFRRPLCGPLGHCSCS